jgi:hypothetical protein
MLVLEGLRNRENEKVESCVVKGSRSGVEVRAYPKTVGFLDIRPAPWIPVQHAARAMMQGTLTEGKGSVQLTSYLKGHFVKKVKKHS